MYNLIMYIIELIAKLLNDKKQRQYSHALHETDYDESCEHIFLPVDSTNETLACSKCGLVIKNDPSKIKPKNPFTM